MILRPTFCNLASANIPLSVSRRSARLLNMPLRAKITNPAMTRDAHTSRRRETDPMPGDVEDDVLFHSKYGVRTIMLNRPKKLNSLDGSMIRKIIPRLLEWQKSDMANVIVLKGEGRALCAGGDVAVLAKDCATGPEGQQRSTDYFALEYKLDHLIATYSKPYVAFMDGITMGGGVGLSVHAPFRIATEKTIFAMPETTIGFFPDVGASFFLSRMEGGLGLYLAMTSERLKGAEAYLAGVATHYLHSSSLPDLEARLAELQFKDYATMEQKVDIIDKTIEEFSTGLPHDQSLHIDTDIRRLIDHVFDPSDDDSQSRLSAVLSRLSAATTDPSLPEASQTWAKKTLATIEERSPTSVAVTERLLHHGAYWNINQAFQHEFHIASCFMQHPDFVTGVTARLIDKTKGRPSWQPAKIEDLSTKPSYIDQFFPELEGDELEVLNTDPATNAYNEYPFATDVGLPTERRIAEDLAEIVAQAKEEDGGQLDERNVEAVLDAANKTWDGRTGVREKYRDVLTRLLRGPITLQQKSADTSEV